MASVTTDQRQGVNASQALKVPCVVAATSNITLSGEQTIDGVAIVDGDRVLLTGQTDASENGIYECDTGSWTRAKDWDGNFDVVKGTTVRAHSGTSNSGYWIVTTSDPITIGTSNVAFESSGALGDFSDTTSTANGDALIGVKRTETNAEATTQHQTNETRMIQIAADYGASLSRTNGTDDWYTVFNNLNTDINTDGAMVVIPPGTYDFDTEIVIDAPDYKRIAIFAYGAEFVTSGAFAGIKITGGSTTGGLSIYGLKINHRGNATATAGFHVQGAWNTRLYDCTVEAHGVGASYAAFLVENTTDSDDSTGSFWTKIINPWVRKRAGADSGNITYGVQLKGAANATLIQGGALGNCTTGVHITIHSGQTTVPNTVTVQDVDFTGFTTGVHVEGAAASTQAGLRFIGNRFETGTTAFSFTTTTAQPARPALFLGNDVASSVTTYLNNPESLVMTNFDASITPDYGTSAMSWKQQTTITAKDGSTDALSLEGLGGNRGLRLKYSGSNALSLLATGVTGGAWIVSGAADELYISGVKGISNTTAKCQNLRGSVTFSTSGTATVTFGDAEADANYYVSISGDANETFFVTSKLTTGFTMNSSNASSTATVDWILIR